MNFGGTVFISSGSTIAYFANIPAIPPIPIFSLVSGLEITPIVSTSEPVPADVVIAIHGSISLGGVIFPPDGLLA